MQPVTRRPMGLREHGWLRSIARGAASLGLTPNAVSILGILFSIAGSVCLIASARVTGQLAVVLLLLVPVMVGLRGLCNLVDGLIAVEGGMRTKSGEVFNDFPDRISDLVLYIGAGYGAISSSISIPLGWSVGALAVLTAYTRLLGGAVGATQYFTGPMAKPHRMAVLSAGCLSAAIERATNGTTWSLVVAMVIIALGCLITIAIRLKKIIRELESN